MSVQTSLTGDLCQISRAKLGFLKRKFRVNAGSQKLDNMNLAHRVFTQCTRIVGASALVMLATVTVFAQTQATGSTASRGAALDQAMDRLEMREERHAANPALSPLAATISVNCNLPASPFGSITAALARLNPQAVNTIRVSGACHENVSIQSFENLTLIANLGASINDASSGNLDVLDVADTHEFNMQGFSINGGSIGVACFDFSLCRFSGNTVQGSSGDGVFVGRARASFQGDTLQNNVGRGLAVVNGSLALISGVTIQANGAPGAVVGVGSQIIAVNLTSRNNGGAGIRITNHSTLRLIDSTLSANGGAGIRLDSSSEAFFDINTTGNTITGNGANGVALFDLSFALFGGSDNITGNNLGNPGGFDVSCGPQFSATRGALTSIGGGTTNCVEP